MVDEMGGGLDHTASVTGGTHTAALATERERITLHLPWTGYHAGSG